MSDLIIETERLRLVLESSEAVLARVEAMSPADRAEISPDWLARIRGEPAPWTHGFALVERTNGEVIGSCGFKGTPDEGGVVEIGYGIDPEHRGLGYAREAAAALVEFAFGSGVRVVRAHTRLASDASARVLMACGFASLGEVIDPEDGPVWRWEIVRHSSSEIPSRA
jgi:RimJ/RimL family protein N-acetyltransferase